MREGKAWWGRHTHHILASTERPCVTAPGRSLLKPSGRKSDRGPHLSLRLVWGERRQQHLVARRRVHLVPECVDHRDPVRHRYAPTCRHNQLLSHAEGQKPTPHLGRGSRGGRRGRSCREAASVTITAGLRGEPLLLLRQ